MDFSTLKRRSRRNLTIIAITSLLAFGHTSEVRAQDEVWLRHSPAHPAADEPVWVAAQALGGPFEKIRITYDVYALSESSDGLFPDQTLLEENKEGGACMPREPLDEIWCFARLPSLGDDRLIAITASAVRTSGETTASESYFFASGNYPGTAPIPIRRSGPVESRLDVVLVPDRISLESTNADKAAALRTFVDRLSTFVNDVFFGFPPYGGTPGNPYRRLYNFYYTSQPSELVALSDPRLCRTGGLPADQAQLETHFDAVALLHCRDPNNSRGYDRRPDATAGDSCQRSQDYRCSANKFMTSEIDYEKTVGHEIGHLLHGLTDEYCGNTAYNIVSSNSNVFRTETSCQEAATRLGYATESCARICASGSPSQLWKIAHPVEPSSIMDAGMHRTHSRFFNPATARILSVYLDCVDNDVCYDDSVEAEAEIPVAMAPQAAGAIAEVGPQLSADNAEFMLPRALMGARPAAAADRGETVVAQSIPELQERLRDPLARIGREAPAEATRQPQGVAAEAESAAVDIGVRVELDGSGVRVVDVAPIGPAIMAAAPAGFPTVTVIGQAADGRTVFSTEVVDPRWIEVEGQYWVRNDSATVTVPLPTALGVSDIVVTPDEPAAPAGIVRPNGQGRMTSAAPEEVREFRVNVEQALRGVCEANRNAPACR